MKTVHFGLRSWTAAVAVAALLVGCGGGAEDGVSGPQAASGTQLHTLALAIAIAPPPDCTVATLSVANIDFGQVGWAGDDSTSDPMAITTLVPASVSFTDNVTYTHTVQWLWGDGTSATGTVTEAAGAGVATQTHTYAAAGVYTVSAIVTSNVCPSKTVTRQLVVYDPTGGYVTGGGWINSPAGAFKADPSLSGRANFGFVAKYLKGATIPIGQTEFQFQTAKLNFHSDSYEWLVVAGARAQYKGAGSVSGNGGFKFLLTAIDGDLLADGKSADRFRIKIWHTDANNSDVIDYDNQSDPTLEGGTIEGTTLGGGSIVIHK